MQSGDPPTLDSSAPSFASSTTSSSLSRKTSVSSHTEIEIPIAPSNTSSEFFEVQHTMAMIHENLNAFEESLRNITHGHLDNSELDNELEEIRKALALIKEDQVHGTEEIELLMKNFIDEKALERIREQVNKEIEGNMDMIVKEEVQAYLHSSISSQLQQELRERKKELDEVHRDLHNSESKRLNSLLNERSINEPLHTLYCSDGKISKHFPKTVHELTSFDADICKALIADYGIDSSESTTKRGNMNRFMVFCGLQLSMLANDSRKTKPH
ncbi:MAG: hypothetical protein NXY57DRAFT_315046 [Lentinula lateritia]|uniref:Uncharacterized protein n=1 Tax=Lentinula lateritia TaxID=40482 RepID=A0ABQ8V0T8_9AGAR|nr:MAG: hypothetical protein NXY57DRAFT_315046 [Lentinula lateritia]KAJ4467280.1 hypothetical protein C8R41DRAFT_53897 [Lentinula lateritia]